MVQLNESKLAYMFVNSSVKIHGFARHGWHMPNGILATWIRHAGPDLNSKWVCNWLSRFPLGPELNLQHIYICTRKQNNQMSRKPEGIPIVRTH